jgi:hypothetical protein
MDDIAVRLLRFGARCAGDAGQDAPEKHASTAEAIVVRTHPLSLSLYRQEPHLGMAVLNWPAQRTKLTWKPNSQQHRR